MPARFEKAPQEFEDLLWRTAEQYHGRLTALDLSIDLLLAFGTRDDDGELVGDAIKIHGVPAAACVRVVNLRDRTKGMGDAEIQIDGDHCDEWSERQLMALLDHELTHLEPQLSPQGDVKRDDLDRVKLTLRPHDRQFGWFDEVARRWGVDSPEAIQARSLVEDWQWTQMYLPSFDLADFGRVQPIAEDSAAMDDDA